MKKVGIIGRVNVGKSTLFNRLIGKRKAIVSPIAGTTRDFISGEIEVNNKKFEIIDFGGMDFVPAGEIEREMNRLILSNIYMLDLVLFVVDGRNYITDKDKRIAELLRRTNKKVILVINKVDGPRQRENIYDFYSLGFEDLVGVSAVNNRNLDILIDMIVEKLEIKEEKEGFIQEELTKIAIVGRPNVGKSSLFNVLCKQERSIVTEIAGTTRDAIDSEVAVNNKRYLFIDTAGLRRKAKATYLLDIFSMQKSLHAIRRSDIVLYMIDALSYAVHYDISLLNYAIRKGKSIIIVINKWDLKKENMNKRKYQDILITDNSIFKKFPFVFISALKKQGIENLIQEIERVDKVSRTKIATSLLNKEIKNITSKFIRAGRAKVFYAIQTQVRPIEILFFVNNKRFFKKEHLNFIEKNLREKFNLLGVPIVFKLRNKKFKQSS